jgi:hypothetical protein
MFNISPGLQITSWWDIECAVQVFIYYKRKIFLYDKGDFDSYRQHLTDVDWETLFGHNDVDTSVDIIANTILNIADNTQHL